MSACRMHAASQHVESGCAAAHGLQIMNCQHKVSTVNRLHRTPLNTPTNYIGLVAGGEGAGAVPELR